MTKLILDILRLLASSYVVEEFLYVSKELHSVARSCLYKVFSIDKLVKSDDSKLLENWSKYVNDTRVYKLNINCISKANKSLYMLLKINVKWFSSVVNLHTGEVIITQSESCGDLIEERAFQVENVEAIKYFITYGIRMPSKLGDRFMNLSLETLDKLLKSPDMLMLKSYRLVPRSYEQFRVLNQNNYNFSRVKGILSEVEKIDDYLLKQALKDWRSKDGKGCTY